MEINIGYSENEQSEYILLFMDYLNKLIDNRCIKSRSSNLENVTISTMGIPLMWIIVKSIEPVNRHILVKSWQLNFTKRRIQYNRLRMFQIFQDYNQFYYDNTS